MFKKYTSNIISNIENIKTHNVCSSVQYVEQTDQLEISSSSDMSKNDLILFSEKQIRCLASDKLRHLHLDATGSIIAQPKLLSTANTIYYYALMLPGNIDGPLPVAEFISSKHDIAAIKHFLDVFNDKLKKITTKIIKKVETDFNLALIQKCYPDGKKQACMRSVAVSLLVNMLHCCSFCFTASAAAEVYSVFVKLFGKECQVENFDYLIQSVKIITEDASSISEIYTPPQIETSSIENHLHIIMHLKKSKLSARENNEIVSMANPFYSKEFYEYVADFIIFPIFLCSRPRHNST
ncbi:hypothetical protein ALC60_02029 [Trachymyrmex zeteki]|uniref:Uncharacterized protein n=1 Tax=Mycetomoellerius zeteki TaxID=64791 RepID=A0A151XF59_9HYME|nr:hypothetical protein ALC60_02029 [Trachymyrmex zeteki]